jgi:Ca2+-binding RTX toxin-like protein
MSLVNVTITGNEAQRGGGIGGSGPGATLGLANAIVAGNSAAQGADVAGTAIQSNGANIFGSAVPTGQPGDLVNVAIHSLQLGPLASNGGPTLTMAIGKGSVAIDAGIAADASKVDQRGFLRDKAPDIGAFEHGAKPLLPALAQAEPAALSSENAGIDATASLAGEPAGRSPTPATPDDLAVEPPVSPFVEQLVEGTNGDDILYEPFGLTRMLGHAGNDLFMAVPVDNDPHEGPTAQDYGPDYDVIDGGPGNDTVSYENVVDSPIVATLDILDGKIRGTVMRTSDPDDFTPIDLDILHNIQNIRGTQMNDLITGNDEDNILWGLGGDDVIRGGGGNDFIDGGHGNDTIFGDSGDNILHGGAGNDVIHAGTGFDQIFGGPGDDVIHAGNSSNLIHGGPGRDMVVYDVIGDVVVDLAGETATVRQSGVVQHSDTVILIEDVITGGGDDIVVGNAADNLIFGGAGNDKLYGGAGNDVLHGGPGHDYLSGGAGDDELHGGWGDDHYRGGPGNDLLVLSPGGTDLVRWAPGDEIGTDTIYDFELGTDGLWFDDGFLVTQGWTKDGSGLASVLQVQQSAAGNAQLVAHTADAGWQTIAEFVGITPAALTEAIADGSILDNDPRGPGGRPGQFDDQPDDGLIGLTDVSGGTGSDVALDLLVIQPAGDVL